MEGKATTLIVAFFFFPFMFYHGALQTLMLLPALAFVGDVQTSRYDTID